MNRGCVYGFTLSEMLVTLAVAAVLLSVAVPSVSVFLQNNRIKSHTYVLLNDIALARGEAVRRGAPAFLCRSADPTAAAPQCGGTGNTWTTGWLVYVNIGGTFDFEPPGDILLKTGASASWGVAIKSDSVGNRWLEYARTGATSEAGTANYTVCDSRGGAHGRRISVPINGRPTVTAGSPSSPITCL